MSSSTQQAAELPTPSPLSSTSPTSPNPPSLPSPPSPGSDSSGTMPGRNSQRGSRPITPKREADLSSLLNAFQRTDLITLTTAITDTMRQEILRMFEVSTGESGDSHGAEAQKRSSWHLLPATFDLKNLDLNFKENAKPTARPSNLDNRRQGGNLDKKARDTLAKEEDEALNTPQAELKKEALANFDKWRSSIVKRVTDISAAKENTQASTSRPPGRASAGGTRSTGKSAGNSSKVNPVPKTSEKQYGMRNLPSPTHTTTTRHANSPYVTQQQSLRPTPH